MYWKLLLMITAGICFCISAAAFVWVRIVLRPKKNALWEQTYWEFEEQDPALVRYQFWNRLTFSAVIVSMLLLFLAVAF